MIAADHVWLLAIALVLDAIVGDPLYVWDRLPHPVAWIGGLIAGLDVWLNNPGLRPRQRYIAGSIAIIVVVAAAAGVAWGVEWIFRAVPFGWVGTAICASVLLAARSLYDHVAAVAAALGEGDLPKARTALGRIVGRDTAALDESAVARGAIETLAESLSDGVIAPAFWFLLLGLPGMAAYKAINTADSMIGHRTERHAEFGWASARLDDLVNLPASRLSGLLVALAAGSARERSASFRAMAADAARHHSPNSGWPEAAMAGALGLALGGPKTYDGLSGDDAWLNIAGRKTGGASDIRRALHIYLGAVAIFALAVAVAGAVVAFR